MVAIEAPELVRRLVLAEAPVIPLLTSFPPKPHEILKLLFTRTSTALSIIKFAATGLGPASLAAKRGDMNAAIKHFGSAVLGKAAYTRLTEARLEQVRVNMSPSEILSDSAMLKLKPSDIMEISSPTLLVVGEQSPRMMHHLTARLVELLPNVERLTVPHASHIMHEDNPQSFNQAVVAFLKNQR